jgi:hypothetical protein
VTTPGNQVRPRSLRLSRAAAVLITSGVGAASFALSFAALRDLAVRGHVPTGLAWLWPLIVDGTILNATLGVVVLASYPQHRRDRRYFWIVLAAAAAASVLSNTLHAIVPASHPLGPWLTGFIASIAPFSLLATTHGLTLLTRIDRALAGSGSTNTDTDTIAPQLDEAGDNADGTDDEPIALHDCSRWHDMAGAVLKRASLKDADLAAVAKVLHLSYDRSCTDREIGRQLKMSHHTVGKIQTTSAQLLREGQFSVAAAS